MTNGFYNTSNLSNAEIKRFVKDAIFKSYRTLVQTKYKNGVSTREIDKDLSIEKVVQTYFSKKSIGTARGLFVVDRFTYNQGIIAKYLCEYEICLSYDWTFLYIYVNEEEFNTLINKYELHLTQWK